VGGNGSGVAGVAWQTQLIAAKFLGPDGGYLSNAVKALDYLTTLKTKYGINIVASNNSWSGGGYSSTLESAITRGAKAGILFVAAAGNAGSNNDSALNYPANYNTTSGAGYDAVISVAAIDQNGNLASFSNYGSTTVDLGAPGVGIYSTLPGNNYGAFSGTSMAAPHVTGASVLYAAANPGATAATIREAILASAQATPTAALQGRTVAGGRLNISAMPQNQPSLSLNDVSIVEGNSGTSWLTFTVKLSTASTQSVSVHYASANGTAAAAIDYTAVSGVLSFDPGITSQTISVPVLGDTGVEGNETFVINLSSSVNATIADAQAIGSIIDDDASLPTISVNNVALSEGDRGWKRFVFSVTLSAPSTQTVSVNYATTSAGGTALSGSDYKGTSGILTFSPGTTSLTVSVNVSGDKTLEQNEIFFLKLSNPKNAVLSPSLHTGTGTITNDDGGASVSSTLNTTTSAIDWLMESLNDDSRTVLPTAKQNRIRGF